MLRLLLICWLAVLALPALAQNRHALVVGIDAYDELPRLGKAVNDARAIAEVLTRSGFRVEAGFDLDRRNFVRLLAGFVAQLQAEDEVLVFYAGHAVEIGRRNYLVPADATDIRRSSEAQVIAESIGQDFLLSQIVARNVTLSVVILDACRDNPFEALVTRGISPRRGLAINAPPRGVFLMYSADEGQEALDGLSPEDQHPNSIYTRTLLPLLETPGLDIVEIARRVRGDVEALAASVGHAQYPEYRDRMQGSGRFFLTPPVETEPEPGPETGIQTALDPCASAVPVWAAIADSDSQTALEGFIATYGGICPALTALARERLAGTANAQAPLPLPSDGPQEAQVLSCEAVATLWNAARDSRDAVILEQILHQAPESCIATRSELANAACHLRAHPRYALSNQLAAMHAAAVETCRLAHALTPDAATAALLGRSLLASGAVLEAVPLTRFAALAEDPVGMNTLGYMHDTGSGVLRNNFEAARLFRNAAELGEPVGMTNFGNMLQDGRGVDRNPAAAVSWYRKAAEAGHAQGMRRLAEMLDSGRGTEQDHGSAAAWFLAAALNGDDWFQSDADTITSRTRNEIHRLLHEAGHFETAPDSPWSDQSIAALRAYIDGG